MPNYRLNVAMGTDIGIRRDHNEDAIGYHYPDDFGTLTTKGVLLIIADGVGSLAKGEEASHYAVDRLIELYYQDESEANIHNSLKTCLEKVNSEVFFKFDGHSATTIVAVVICQSDVITAYVGDSRSYLFDSNSVRQHTTDHARSFDVGNKRRKTKLTRAIGHNHSVNIDILNAQLDVGHGVLLLTDGATPYFSEDDLCSMMMRKKPSAIVTDIIQYSNRGGGLDNISAIVLSVDGILEDETALRQHINQLPDEVKVDYATRLRQPIVIPQPRPEQFFLFSMVVLLSMIIGLLFYIQITKQDISASITQIPALSTLVPYETPYNLTVTPLP